MHYELLLIHICTLVQLKIWNQESGYMVGRIKSWIITEMAPTASHTHHSGLLSSHCS